MRERDLNRNFTDDTELRRIKTILFPKKLQPAPTQTAEHPRECSTHVRSEIERLRSQINCMLSRGGEQQSRSTERAYLDGISKLARQLKNSAGEVREVFEQFLAHLPTRLASDPPSYTLHYHYSLLLQHIAWDRMTRLFRIPLASAFLAVKERAAQVKELQQRMAQVQQRQVERQAKRRQLGLGKAFNAWRLNGKCMEVKQQSEEYLREHSLEGEQRLAQSLLDLPLLVLMLEELAREAADISELLVLDESGEKACKFMEEGVSAINSSLETVTQRSLLQSGRGCLKFSRFQLALTPSLTRICTRKGEIMFISSLAKSLDYGQADNLCYWQSLGKSSPQSLKGGAIFYPIFDGQQHCIALLRQYFYEGSLTAVSSAKLEKICTFLELGLNMQRRMRIIARERAYQKEGYYMKMISLVKKLEAAEGSEKEAMSLLSEELKSKLGIEKLRIYKLNSSQSEKDISLKHVWGEGEDCSSVLALAHQLLKQHSNYIYLEQRLVVYSNQMLFDLKLASSTSNDNPPQQLPVDLIVNVLAKTQTLLVAKEKETREMMKKEQLERQASARKEAERLKADFEQLLLKFIASANRNQHYTTQITKCVTEVNQLINRSSNQAIQCAKSVFYLQCQLSKSKKDRFLLCIAQDKEEKVEEMQATNISIAITDIVTLHCSIPLPQEAQHLEASLSSAIQLFMKAYLKQASPGRKKERAGKDIESSNHEVSLPSQKKQWQLRQLQAIYDSFKKNTQTILSQKFSCDGPAIWQKERPNITNLEDWKHCVYEVFQNSESVSIEIINKNPIITYEEYCSLRALTNYQFEAIMEQSSLLITCNRPAFRPKSAIYENSLIISLPLYYHSPNHACQDKTTINEALSQLKHVLLRKCQDFICGVNIYNKKTAFAAENTITTLVDKLNMDAKRQALAKIRQKSVHHQQLIKNVHYFAQCIKQFSIKLQFQSFHKIFCLNQSKVMQRRTMITRSATIAHFCDAVGRLYFKKSFLKLKSNFQQAKSKKECVRRLEGFGLHYQRKLLHECLMKLHSLATKRSKIGVFMQIIEKKFQYYCFVGFSKLKRTDPLKEANTEMFTEFEKCRSIQEIRQKLQALVPHYTLQLQVTPDDCITLYSPKEAVDTHLNTYQAGPEGQFIWHYPLKQGEGFQIKDRLNSLSKCMEFGIKNCKRTMGMKLAQCSAFHKGWIKRIKSKYLQIWQRESARLEMVERNRLNDSLYQMGVESKTLKEKLKAQEKVLKNNSVQFQELLRKQEDYKACISANNQQIKVIEENQIKLENTRSIYLCLHRKSVLKGMFLLWRSHASELTIRQAEEKLRNNAYFKKAALKAILRVCNDRRRDYLIDFCMRLSTSKSKSPFNPKEIQKIQVMFEERGARLVTFQSELEEQENSCLHSNRSEDQSQFHHTKRQFDLNRSPLQKVQLSADDYARHGSGAYKLNPKTLKFLKRMGKLDS